MFSQCFCDLAMPLMQVAEMLCQHLSLLDSENGRKRQREGVNETEEQEKQKD